MSSYQDLMGKNIEVGDRIHYASKGSINLGRVLEILPNNKGIRIRGKDKQRESVLPKTNTQVIVVVKGYYNNLQKAQRNTKA